jgi:hypothetical protein
LDFHKLLLFHAVDVLGISFHSPFYTICNSHFGQTANLAQG